MRKRFVQQLVLGQRPIEDTPIPLKNKDKVTELCAALKSIYCNKKYNERIFNVLEDNLLKNKKKTGRKGMDLWAIFVLAEVRLALNTSYEFLHNLANNHHTIRYLMGVEFEFGYPRKEFSYQNIYDNVSLLSDEMIAEINAIVLEFGHKEVFKKKETTALRLKTDSFVVESNVHFPADFTLLWDSARKILDTVSKVVKKHAQVKGWRKLNDWFSGLKGLMRELGKASSSGGKGKESRKKSTAQNYLTKAKALYKKIAVQLVEFPIGDEEDLGFVITIEYFHILLHKHIDLVERRVIKDEEIPHEEKMFSIFETYTEWVKKGKKRPNVELGKKLSITTDQFDLIVDYRLMTDEQDRDIVIELADRMLSKYKITSWSFDKGYWNRDNKKLLQLEIPQVIMPKLGKRNKAEEAEEKSPGFKRLKNKHNAIESNINELEHRGLDRCPDRGIKNYTKYIGLGVCAYNLKKIGRKIMQDERLRLEKEGLKFKPAA